MRRSPLRVGSRSDRAHFNGEAQAIGDPEGMRLPAWAIAFFMVMVPAMAIATFAAAACTIPTDKAW